MLNSGESRISTVFCPMFDTSQLTNLHSRPRCRASAWRTSCGTPCRAATGWRCPGPSPGGGHGAMSKVLGKSWGNLGEMLGKCWGNVGEMLGWWNIENWFRWFIMNLLNLRFYRLLQIDGSYGRNDVVDLSIVFCNSLPEGKCWVVATNLFGGLEHFLLSIHWE